MIYKTYEEWQKIGYQVEQGQKSHKRNKAGKAVFSEDQVLGQDDYDYDDPMIYFDPYDKS